MGSIVVQQVIKDLMPLGFENSTDLLLTGSSAGGTGVMLNLDPVEELIHETLKLPRVSVRGVTDSGWFLDRDPFAPTGKPAFDAIRKGMQHWQGKVPKRCKQMYMDEPWRCYFGYRLYPTLKSMYQKWIYSPYVFLGLSSFLLPKRNHSITALRILTGSSFTFLSFRFPRFLPCFHVFSYIRSLFA